MALKHKPRAQMKATPHVHTRAKPRVQAIQLTRSTIHPRTQSPFICAPTHNLGCNLRPLGSTEAPSFIRGQNPYCNLLTLYNDKSAGSPACFVDVSGIMVSKGVVLCLALFGCADFGSVRSPPPPSCNCIVLKCFGLHCIVLQ